MRNWFPLAGSCECDEFIVRKIFRVTIANAIKYHQAQSCPIRENTLLMHVQASCSAWVRNYRLENWYGFLLKQAHPAIVAKFADNLGFVGNIIFCPQLLSRLSEVAKSAISSVIRAFRKQFD